MDLKEEDILGDAVSDHWYYRSKAAALLSYVKDLDPGLVLDVGAGSGFFSKELLEKTDAREGLCIDTNYQTEHDVLVNGKPVHYRTHKRSIDADLVLMMDVLEHVDDDHGLLIEYVEKVASGTHFLITVPAFNFLWSNHDVVLGHRRRYTLRQVEKVAEKAGLVLEHGSYYFGLVFPIAATLRLLDSIMCPDRKQLISGLKKHSRTTNSILMYICTVDRLFLHINRLVGLTAFCLARKP